jgi:hypothetical protein
MYADEALTDEVDLTIDLDTDDLMLTPLDPEFHHLIADPQLSAELAALRQPRPEPTSALLDGSALARRDRRIAQRALGNTVRVLRAHTVSPVTTDGEAA